MRKKLLIKLEIFSHWNTSDWLGNGNRWTIVEHSWFCQNTTAKQWNTRLQGSKEELKEIKSIWQESTCWFRYTTVNFRQPVLHNFIL